MILEENYGMNRFSRLARQLAQEFRFVHVILERLAAIDKNDWYLVVELSPQFNVTIDINFFPGESAAA
jgi:hypothetical protein